MKYYAGIDIGTNTLLLLILSKDQDGNISIIKDEHRIARLGEGINKSGNISDKAIQRAITILEEYAILISQYTNISVRVIATSAMRDAQNKVDVQNEKVKIEGVKKEDIVLVNAVEHNTNTETKKKVEKSNNHNRQLKKLDVDVTNIIDTKRVRKPKITAD